MGFWHIFHFAPDVALDRLRSGISKFNESTGGSNTETSGYHETITRFYVAVISHFVANRERTRPIEELAEELLKRVGANDLPLRYWSCDWLVSTGARSGWLEPDLQPLEFPA